MSLEKKALSGAKWMTISTGFVTLFALLKISILTRFLDKSDFGLIAIVTFVLGFINLFMDLGLSSAILHKQHITKDEFASLYWLNFGFSILLYLIILISTPFISRFYSERELVSILPLMGMIIIISALGQQFRTIEQKSLNFRFISIVEISSSIFSLLSAILLAIQGYGVYSLVYSALLMYFITNIAFLVKGLVEDRFKFHFLFAETKPFLRIGIYNTGGQVLNYFNKGLDILIIGKFFGIEILGGYSLAKQLVLRPLQIINPIITKVSVPVLARFQSNLKKLESNYLKLINIVATLYIPGYLLIIIFASPIVKLLYGADYINIVNLVRLLSFYMIFVALRIPMGSLIISTGKTYLEFYWFLFTFPIMPIAIIFGATYSIEGVAIAEIIAMIILFLPFWRLVIRKMIPVSLVHFLRAHIPTYIWLKEIIYQTFGVYK